MAATMIIPTEFTAVDKFTSVVKQMTAGVSNFTKSTASAVQRVNNKIDGVFSRMSGLSQLLLGLSVGAVFSSAIQDIKNYDDAIASFRTIVSDLSDKDFEKYRMQVGLVAKDTKKSSVDVANSFEKIAALNADLAKTATGLATVSKEAILLSKASGFDETENLVGIMNQFNLEAKDAARVSNVLAAGQASGAASITQSSEAYKNFGSVAKGANITLEQSQALIQTLAQKQILGAEAGTKLRGVTLQLQKAGLGYASGQFQINDALFEAVKEMNKLSTAKEKDAYLTKLFGAENITAGKIVLGNIDVYEQFTKSVTGTNATQEQAAIKSATLSNRLMEMKNSFTTLITTNDKSNKILNITKDVLLVLADNMDVVVAVVLGLIGAYATMKAIMILTTIATFAQSVAMGVNAAATGAMSLAMKGNTVALGVYSAASWIATTATKAYTTAQWLLNAAMLANPIGLIIAAIVALIALVVSAIYYWEEWGASMLMILGPLGWIINLIMTLRKHWDSIKAAFETDGIIGGFKRLGLVLLDVILYPLQQILELISKIPGVGKFADSGLESLKKIRTNMNLTENSEVQVVTPKQESMSKQNTMNGSLDINLRDKGGFMQSFENNVNGFIPVNVSSTQGAF